MSEERITATIPEAIAELKAGRLVILVDDEDRENEGDLVCAAELVTPEIIHFMTRHTPGYLCVALTGMDCDRLELHPQSASNTALRGTAMAVSVDGVSLTVNAIPAPGVIQVSLIPFTLQETTLGERAAGDEVHLEGDTVGKYVRALMEERRDQA